MTKAIKIRKGLANLSDEDRWDILNSYIKNQESNAEIAERHSLSIKSFEDFIRSTYSSFQNTRETKMLLATTNRPDLFETLKQKYIDSDQINEKFLEKLSGDTDLLSDSELLFCEFLMEYGDDAKAIEKAKLNVGLKKTTESLTSYNDALKLRSFYLKKKTNVASYLNEQRKRNLDILKDGKGFIQSNLITIMEQLKNNNDLKHLPSHLKAIDSLARTIGAFDDKLTLHNADGDDVLDAILLKAKAKNTEPEKHLLAYTGEGEELYEED